MKSMKLKHMLSPKHLKAYVSMCFRQPEFRKKFFQLMIAMALVSTVRTVHSSLMAPEPILDTCTQVSQVK